MAKTKSTAVAVVRRPQAPVVAGGDSGSIMAMIGAASKDKTVDVAKMERLVDLFERIKNTERKEAYAAAMVELKPKLPVIDRRGRIVVRKKTATGYDGEIQQNTPYALWEDIDEAITPILHEHGFSLTFRTGNEADGRLRVTAILLHKGGHSEDTSMALPFDTSGSKNNVQAIGSSTSYGKRYTATAILNLRTKGEDDDGVKGGHESTSLALITEKQVEEIIAACASARIDKSKFCTAFQISEVEELPAMRMTEALARINEFRMKFEAKPKKKTEDVHGV